MYGFVKCNLGMNLIAMICGGESASMATIGGGGMNSALKTNGGWGK